MPDHCRNTKCGYHRRDGNGCGLFKGLTFVKCTRAIN